MLIYNCIYLGGLVMKHKDYRINQINLQLKWRNTQDISKEYGWQNGRQYSHIIPKSEWSKTIWEPIRYELLKYLENEKVQQHTGSHNLLSSWVLCSNLYFGIRINENMRELFKAFLQEKLALEVDKIDVVHLEFAFEDKLNPENLLGELGGKRGSGQTSPDVAIEYSKNGHKSILLIECKYTEHSFYDCSARRSKYKSRGTIVNSNPKRCLDKVVLSNFENNCHQNVWGRKYWKNLKISEFGKERLGRCPACYGGYQLVRQQALAEGVANEGAYVNVASCVAFDGRNEYLMKSIKGSGIDSIENEWGKLFDMKSKFLVWKHQEWVEYVRKHKDQEFENNWVKYLKNRYEI
jgi:hypothetical protein